MNISGISLSAGSSIQRPVASAEAPQFGSFPAASGISAAQDSVSLSPLASSLRDESLTAFNTLSSEMRTQLSSLVDSGALTGEDVHNALKHRMKEARLNAYSATFRMAHNDHADLFFDESATAGDFQNALRATSARRAQLMEKLSALEGEGQANSEEYAGLSKQLVASDMNPKLLADRSGMTRHIMDPFHTFDMNETRLMQTYKETDAAYKLKGTGIDLSAIDRSLRSVGEQDAAAIVAERAGLSHANTVAKDKEFSINDALFKSIPVPATTAGALESGNERVNGGVRASIEASISTMQREGKNPFGDAEALRQYWRGIRARY